MRTLVLNSNYSPLGSVPWEKAIVLVFSEKVEILEEYERLIRSTSFSMKAPSVVKLHTYIKNKYVNVRFNKDNVYLRDSGKCQYCLKKITLFDATFDHVLPKSRGGETNWTNIVTCCYSCNQQKDVMTPTEAKMVLHSIPKKPSGLPLSIMFSLKYQDKVPDSWKNWLLKD